MLTIKEISDRLNIPESTLRYYREQYEDCLPVEGQGRQRRYKEEAIDLFATIAAMTKEGKSRKQIENVLAVQTVIEVEPQTQKQVPQKSNKPALTKDNSLAVEFKKDFNTMNSKIDDLTVQIATQTREIAELREMLGQKKKSLFARLFGK